MSNSASLAFSIIASAFTFDFIYFFRELLTRFHNNLAKNLSLLVNCNL